MLFSIFNILRIFETLPIFFYKFLLKWEKIQKDFESTIFLEAQKYYFAFESRLNFFFKWSYLQRFFDVPQRCENRRWKWQHCLRLFNSTLKYTTIFQRCKLQGWHTQRCFDVDLTWCNVPTLYQLKSNVEPTLKCLLGTDYITGWDNIDNYLLEKEPGIKILLLS